MSARNVAKHRCGPIQYDSEIERLCGYLKNDSLIRWKTGCSQAEIDTARHRLAGRFRPEPNPVALASDDLKHRQRRAEVSNKRYLAALARVAQ